MRSIPAWGGTNFSFAKRWANLDAAWAPTWASRNAADEEPTGEAPSGRGQASPESGTGFIQPIINYNNHSVVE